MKPCHTPCILELENGYKAEGNSFGARIPVAGEVVFNTGMVGYQESLTDPSYKGQILTLTYPLIGNYGIPRNDPGPHGLGVFESDRIQASALIVSEHAEHCSHHSAEMNLHSWLLEQGIPGLSGIDTRELTKQLRDQGSMLGRIYSKDESVDYYDPNKENLLPEVSISEATEYGSGDKTVLVLDCGLKNSILTSLLNRGVRVLRVPWDYDFTKEKYDGVLVTNGPGDPAMGEAAIAHLQKAMKEKLPIMGICLGHQLMSRAAGAQTYKMKFGHRSQNQPAVEVGSKRCFMTSQNHGFAVSTDSLPNDWTPWFHNGNDQSNEGIRHKSKPFMSVQFHPEAVPGPIDSNYLFNDFVELL